MFYCNELQYLIMKMINVQAGGQWSGQRTHWQCSSKVPSFACPSRYRVRHVVVFELIFTIPTTAEDVVMSHSSSSRRVASRRMPPSVSEGLHL